MSKHTPGPWYADKEGYIYRRPLSELYEYGGGIAGDKPLAAAWKGWYEEHQTGYPVQANARLIAAAPEMYELLERAGEIMIELESLIDNAFTNDASAQKSQWLLDADALLAKIDGGGE